MRAGTNCFLSACIWIGLLSQSAQGDGGVVQLSGRHGPYQVTVFTSPIPFRAGPVDVSVFVQHPVTGVPVPDVSAIVELESLDQPGLVVRQPATVEAATNKLFRAAIFDLPAAGRWQVTVTLAGNNGRAQARFVTEAAEGLPTWTGLSFWISLPAVVVCLFVVHQVLVRRTVRKR